MLLSLLLCTKNEPRKRFPLSPSHLSPDALLLFVLAQWEEKPIRELQQDLGFQTSLAPIRLKLHVTHWSLPPF